MISAQSTPPVQAARTIPAASVGLLAAGSATLNLLAQHPVAEHHAGAALLTDLVERGASGAHVHGALTGLLCILLYGVLTLAHRIGLQRPAVGFGLAAYGFGCAAMIGAMLFDGFVTARLAEWLLAHGQADGGAALALVAICIQVLTKAGLIGMGLGVCCLSWARARSTRLLAALGVLGGLLPALAVMALGLRLEPQLLIALTGLQALWYAGAALWLWRAPLNH
jgi:hypothetical protein